MAKAIICNSCRGNITGTKIRNLQQIKNTKYITCPWCRSRNKLTSKTGYIEIEVRRYDQTGNQSEEALAIGR